MRRKISQLKLTLKQHPGKLINKDIKTVYDYMFKKLEQRLNLFCRNMKDIYMTQIKLVEMKTIMSNVKSTLARMNERLDIAEKIINELKDIAIETI